MRDCIESHGTRPPRASGWRWILLTGVLALSLALVTPGVGSAEETVDTPVQFWEAGARKSFFIPALEIGGFIVGLNLIDRYFVDSEEYGSDVHSIRKNLTTREVIDNDPFSTNQLGHPYAGSIYYGFARSAGLTYWQSLLYTIGGSLAWETFGETTPPSLNDNIASGIAGTFLGETLFRMASLLLESGGDTPGLWRELGAAVLSPPTAFNRHVFGDRFSAVFPSRNPAIFIRLRFGATLTTNVTNVGLLNDPIRQEGSIDVAMTYGLPGKPGYRYTRPFDYFHFEFTGVPNASSVPNGVENLSIRGLLVGATYEGGDSIRGVWGLFGSYDYLSPQLFRVSTTAVSIGTIAQWWLGRQMALQGTALSGIGLAAAGTVADKDERDYHYGVSPRLLLGMQLSVGDRGMVEAAGRLYYIAGTSAGGGGGTNQFGHEIITRGNVGATVRIYGRHAIGIHYLVSSRDTSSPDVRDRHQSVQTVSLSYILLSHTRFGAVEWRPQVAASH